MTPEEALLATAETVLEDEGWVSGYLYDPNSGGHCALGAIGRARFGRQFDHVAEDNLKNSSGVSAYSMLLTDPMARKSVFMLANEVQAAQGRNLIEYVPSHRAIPALVNVPLEDPVGEKVLEAIMGYNDPQNRSTWRTTVKARFSATWQKVRKIPKDHGPEVVHVQAGESRPQRVEETQQEEVR